MEESGGDKPNAKQSHRMICPECGLFGGTIDSRRPDNRTIKRRYECANKHRFTTYERIEKLPEEHLQEIKDILAGRR